MDIHHKLVRCNFNQITNVLCQGPQEAKKITTRNFLTGPGHCGFSQEASFWMPSIRSGQCPTSYRKGKKWSKCVCIDVSTACKLSVPDSKFADRPIVTIVSCKAEPRFPNCQETSVCGKRYVDLKRAEMILCHQGLILMAVNRQKESIIGKHTPQWLHSQPFDHCLQYQPSSRCQKI